eukprot:1176638-Prorocentrum_minimum.AAC.2
MRKRANLLGGFLQPRQPAVVRCAPFVCCPCGRPRMHGGSRAGGGVTWNLCVLTFGLPAVREPGCCVPNHPTTTATHLVRFPPPPALLNPASVPSSLMPGHSQAVEDLRGPLHPTPLQVVHYLLRNPPKDHPLELLPQAPRLLCVVTDPA